MRVLYLNPFSQQISGPDESLRTLLGALVPMGVEPHVVLPRPGPYVSFYKSLGATVHFAPLSVLRRRMTPSNIMLYPLRLLRGARAVSRIVRRERIEVIHTNMEVVLDGAIASRWTRVPHVLHYRGNSLDRPAAIFDVLTRVWTSSADRVLCISQATAGIFARRGLGEKIEVLHDPVDVKAFADAERLESVRRDLGAGPSDLLLGTVARIHPRKDIATFLRAGALVMQKVPGARLVVVGTAEATEEVAYAAELRQLAADLGIEGRLCWAGLRRDMPSVMKALDLFMLCSRHEGFGIVVAEALAASCPVVLSNEGALPELVAYRQAALAQPGSESDFAGLALAALDSSRAPQAGPAASSPSVTTAFAAAQRVVAVYDRVSRRPHAQAP